MIRFLLHVQTKATIYDIDDADYVLGVNQVIYKLASLCDIVAAGSQEIAHHLKPCNENVVLLTTPVLDLKIKKVKRNKEFTIGWIGAFGGENKKGLEELVFPAIKSLSFNCKLFLLGITGETNAKEIRDYFDDNQNITIIIPLNVNWLNEYEIQSFIAGFDVGVATLLSTPYQIAKSGIKAKQYLNNGIPVLSSNLPENNHYVQHGQNGLLCTTSSDFVNGIIKFYEMSDFEYESYCNNAKKSVLQFNHEYYLSVLDKIIS